MAPYQATARILASSFHVLLDGVWQNRRLWLLCQTVPCGWCGQSLAIEQQVTRLSPPQRRWGMSYVYVCDRCAPTHRSPLAGSRYRYYGLRWHEERVHAECTACQSDRMLYEEEQQRLSDYGVPCPHCDGSGRISTEEVQSAEGASHDDDIDALDVLPPPTRNVLRRNDYRSVAQVCNATDQELLSLRNLGFGHLRVIREHFPHISPDDLPQNGRAR